LQHIIAKHINATTIAKTIANFYITNEEPITNTIATDVKITNAKINPNTIAINFDETYYK